MPSAAGAIRTIPAARSTPPASSPAARVSPPRASSSRSSPRGQMISAATSPASCWRTRCAVSWVGRHPNLQLLESAFECCFESAEERAVLRRIGYIHKDACQVISINLSALFPNPLDGLRLRGDSPEPLAEFLKGLPNRLIR